MRRVIPVVLIAGTLALTGCGGSSGSAGTSSTSLTGSTSSTSSEPSVSAFTSAFKVQKAKLRALGVSVGAAVTGAAHKSDIQLTDEFKALAARATALSGALGQLEAPAKYKADLGSLVSSLTQVAGTLHAIEAAAAANDESAAKAGGEAIVTEAEQVKSDDNALSVKLGLASSP
jgi:hypothetical protein